jgi:hypothetical protein
MSITPENLPLTVGGLTFQKLRPMLPPRWQYGWRWTSLKVAWTAMLTYIGYGSCKAMFFMTNEEIDQKSTEYTFIRDDRGRVVDIGWKPIVNGGTRARARAQQLLDDDL